MDITIDEIKKNKGNYEFKIKIPDKEIANIYKEMLWLILVDDHHNVKIKKSNDDLMNYDPDGELKIL